MILKWYEQNIAQYISELKMLPAKRHLLAVPLLDLSWHSLLFDY